MTNEFHHLLISICFPSWFSKLSDSPTCLKWADDTQKSSMGPHGRQSFLLLTLKALVVLLTFWAGAWGTDASLHCSEQPSSLVLGAGNTPAFFLLGSVCFLTVTLKAPYLQLVWSWAYGTGLPVLPYLLLTAFLTAGFSRGLDHLMGKNCWVPAR